MKRNLGLLGLDREGGAREEYVGEKLILIEPTLFSVADTV